MTQCLETKRTLSGNTERYQCELVSLQDGFGILRYVTDQHYDIAGFRLSPGDETLALYWANAPYTLYIWHRKTQGDRAYYFNIAKEHILANYQDLIKEAEQLLAFFKKHNSAG